MYDSPGFLIVYIAGRHKRVMGESAFNIKPINTNDLDAVLEIYRQSEDFLALGPQPKASMEMVLQDIETSRNENGLFCGIYASEGSLVGIIDYIPNDFDGVNHIAFISLLMLAARWRNQGIGSKILEIIEGKIRVNNRVSEIQTAVQSNNLAALRFWQKNDYRVIGNPEPRPDRTVVLYLRKKLFISD